MLLDTLLDSVKPRESELTLDVFGYSPEDRARIVAAARGRGLSAAGTDRWLLIRDLRGIQ
jgi:hypothetical protein